jgi:hypothetical protein
MSYKNNMSYKKWVRVPLIFMIKLSDNRTGKFNIIKINPVNGDDPEPVTPTYHPHFLLLENPS